MANRDQYQYQREREGSWSSPHDGDDRAREAHRDQQRNFDRARDDGDYRGEQSYGRPGQYRNRERGDAWGADDRGDRYGQRGYGEASGQYGPGGYPRQNSGGGYGARGYGAEDRQADWGASNGTYGQQDYAQSARRSQWREDQRYSDHGGAGDNYGLGPRQGDGARGDASGPGRHDHEPHYRQWRDQQLAAHDQDYARWRDQQAQRYDNDYQTWRGQRHEAFSQEFHQWRADNARNTGVGGTSPTGSSGDPSGLSGAATGARGAQSGHSGPVSGVAGSSGGTTGSAGITGGSSDLAGYPGAAGTGAVVGSYQPHYSSGARSDGVQSASGGPTETTTDIVQNVTDGHAPDHKKDDDKKR